MRHPNELGTHMVVIGGGDFHVAPITSEGWRETEWSKRERAKLVRSHGLQPDGSMPGLVKSFAMRMAVQMRASRKRRRRARA